MKTRYFAALMAAVLLSAATGVGSAQTTQQPSPYNNANVISIHGTITGPTVLGINGGSSPSILLSGQNSCSVTLSGATASFSAIVDGSNDLATWTANPGINSGNAITANGSYSGTIVPNALGAIALQVNSLSSGVINYVMTCSTAQIPSSGGSGGSGATPIPYPTATSAPNALLVHSDGSFPGGSGGPASPGPTDTAGVPYSHPTGVPTFAPAPTPIATPAGGVYPISGAPTPIPTPAGGIYPISGAPSPIPTLAPVNGGQPITCTSGGCPTAAPPPYGATNAQAASANSFVGSACVFNTAPTLTAGQVQACLVDVAGNQLVNLITALPIGTNSIGLVGLNAGSNTIGAVNVNAPYTMATSAPQTGVANSAIGVAGIYNASSPSIANGQVAPIQLTGNAFLKTVICSNTAALCQTFATPADGLTNTQTNPITESLNASFDGVSWDRARKDTYAAGPQWMTLGGSANTAIAAGTAGPTVVKSSAGRLSHVLITTAGTTSEAWYDNATTCSGTIIGITPASTTVGQVIVFDTVAVNGITACGASGTSPATTSSYY